MDSPFVEVVLEVEEDEEVVEEGEEELVGGRLATAEAHTEKMGEPRPEATSYPGRATKPDG